MVGIGHCPDKMGSQENNFVNVRRSAVAIFRVLIGGRAGQPPNDTPDPCLGVGNSESQLLRSIAHEIKIYQVIQTLLILLVRSTFIEHNYGNVDFHPW